jgi:hypothetical protein
MQSPEVQTTKRQRDDQGDADLSTSRKVEKASWVYPDKWTFSACGQEPQNDYNQPAAKATRNASEEKRPI